MPLQTIFSSGQGDGSLDQGAFAVIVFAIIIGWILVSVFQRVLENLFFETLGMNSRSTLHALIIAAVMISIFLVFVWMIDEYQIIPAGQAADTLAEATGGLASATSSTTNTVTSQLTNLRRGHPIVITPTNFF